MTTYIDKILNELSYRVSNGTPNFTNEQHLIKLSDVLKELDWPIEGRVELIKNLQELQKYNPKLNDKKSILFISKIDIVNNTTEDIKNIPNDIEIEYISSVTGKNIDSSISKLSSLL